MQSTIHILTAVHNNLANLKKLLSSIDKQSYRNYTVTVVDDGSTEHVKNYLTDKYPSVQYLSGNGKLWWTGSLNLGLKHILKTATDDDFILTINNDCVVSPTYLETIYKNHGDRIIVGSKVVDIKTGTLWDRGEIIDWSKGEISGRKKNSDPLDAIATKGTLYPVAVFKEVGLLAKQLPHYISDYEYAIRAKRSGYQLKICESCLVKNDTTNTGIGDDIPSRLSFSKSLKLLFDRKSKLNIVDHFWFITLSCPLKYKPMNYLRLAVKTVYLLVLPIAPLHRLLKVLRQRYNTWV